MQSVHIIDGRVKHALLLEILTDAGVGTVIPRQLSAAHKALLVVSAAARLARIAAQGLLDRS